MAIQLDMTTSQYGTPFAGAYFRIATAAISRMRQGGPKFTVMIDVAGYATGTPDDDTREVDFRRYHADLTEVEAPSRRASFIDKCYAWVMAQEDMAGSIAV